MSHYETRRTILFLFSFLSSCANILTMIMEEAKRDVALFMARSYQRGLTTTTGGNISARFGGLMLITPSGKDKSSLKEEDIAVVDIQSGENLTPEKKLSIETDMHRLIYLKRDDVYSVVHSHPTYSCLFSCSEEEVNTSLIAESWYLLDKVVRIEYRRMGTIDLAEIVSAKVAKGSNAVLLAQHGALCVGKSVTNAFDRLECLEQACKLTLLSHIVKTENLTEEQKNEIALMR